MRATLRQTAGITQALRSQWEAQFTTTQAASRQRLEALFESLLHRAFNGEL